MKIQMKLKDVLELDFKELAIVDHSRWYVQKELLFDIDGKKYLGWIHWPATESQEFEDSDELIELWPAVLTKVEKEVWVIQK